MKDILQTLKAYQEGLFILAVSFVIFFVLFGNPLNDYQLMTRSETVTGLAVEVSDYEDREDNGIVKRYFFIEYEFTAPSGEKISDIVEEQGVSKDRGFRTGQPLEIQYLAGAPHIHRIKALSSTTLSGWIFKYVFFGLLAIVPGFYLLYRSYHTRHKQPTKKSP